MNAIQFHIVEHYRQLTDSLYEYKKTVMQPALKDVSWQEIVSIDKILAITMCRDQENITLLEAKDVVTKFINENEEI